MGQSKDQQSSEKEKKKVNSARTQIVSLLSLQQRQKDDKVYELLTRGQCWPRVFCHRKGHHRQQEQDAEVDADILFEEKVGYYFYSFNDPFDGELKLLKDHVNKELEGPDKMKMSAEVEQILHSDSEMTELPETTVKQEILEKDDDIEMDETADGFEKGVYKEYFLKDMDNGDIYFGTVSKGPVCMMWDRNDDKDEETFYTSPHHPGRRLTLIKTIQHKGYHHLEAAFNAEIQSEARKKVAELRKLPTVNKQKRNWAVKCLPHSIQVKLSKIVKRLAEDFSIDVLDIEFPFKFKLSIMTFKTEPEDSAESIASLINIVEEPTDSDSSENAFEAEEDTNEKPVFWDEGEETEDEDIVTDSVFTGLEKGAYNEYILIDRMTEELYCGTVSRRGVCAMWTVEKQNDEIVYTSRHHVGRNMKKVRTIPHFGLHHIEAMYNAEIFSECRKIAAKLRDMKLVNLSIRNWAMNCLPASLQHQLLRIITTAAESSMSLAKLEFPIQFKVQIQLFKLEPELMDEDYLFDKNLWSPDAEVSCYFCNEMIQRCQLLQHMLKHTKERHYACRRKYCTKRFPDESSLKNHMQHHTGEKPFKCPEKGCTKQFSKKSKLDRHMRKHTGERPFKCPEKGCTKKFSWKGNLVTHILTHTGERRFKCPKDGCDMEFYVKARLDRHMKTHTGERPFECPEKGCTKKFSEKSNLVSHMKTHTGERPFECPEKGCTKKFSWKGNLVKHMKTHTGESPFKCPEKDCKKKYFEKRDLVNHMKSHTGERPFKCPKKGCTKKFSSKNTLVRHMRRHTGERPFKCPEKGCTKKYFDKWHLDNHMKSHTGERPFKCPEKGCTKKFYLKQHLDSHMKTHTGKKPIKK